MHSLHDPLLPQSSSWLQIWLERNRPELLIRHRFLNEVYFIDAGVDDVFNDMLAISTTLTCTDSSTCRHSPDPRRGFLLHDRYGPGSGTLLLMCDQFRDRPIAERGTDPEFTAPIDQKITFGIGRISYAWDRHQRCPRQMGESRRAKAHPGVNEFIQWVEYWRLT